MLLARSHLANIKSFLNGHLMLSCIALQKFKISISANQPHLDVSEIYLHRLRWNVYGFLATRNHIFRSTNQYFISVKDIVHIDDNSKLIVTNDVDLASSQGFNDHAPNMLPAKMNHKGKKSQNYKSLFNFDIPLMMPLPADAEMALGNISTKLPLSPTQCHNCINLDTMLASAISTNDDQFGSIDDIYISTKTLGISYFKVSFGNWFMKESYLVKPQQINLYDAEEMILYLGMSKDKLPSLSIRTVDGATKHLIDRLPFGRIGNNRRRSVDDHFKE